MTILIGSARTVNGQVTITPPAGHSGSIHAVRLSNYSGELLILTNMYSERPGREYLVPFQQMVYQIFNFQEVPTIVGILLGTAFDTARLLVEWSTEPLADFPGRYPVDLTQADLSGIGGAAPSWEVFELPVPNDAASHSIPAQITRSSLTFFNDGAVNVAYRAVDTGWGVNDPVILPGSGRTVNTTAAVFFRSLGAGSIQWFATGFGL